jgi:hypothetical protein
MTDEILVTEIKEALTEITALVIVEITKRIKSNLLSYLIFLIITIILIWITWMSILLRQLLTCPKAVVLGPLVVEKMESVEPLPNYLR